MTKLYDLVAGALWFLAARIDDAAAKTRNALSRHDPNRPY